MYIEANTIILFNFVFLLKHNRNLNEVTCSHLSQREKKNLTILADIQFPEINEICN